MIATNFTFDSDMMVTDPRKKGATILPEKVLKDSDQKMTDKSRFPGNNSVNDIIDAIPSDDSNSIMTLSTLGRYRFRNPIPFTVHRDEESFIHIENDEAELYAIGKTAEEVCQDLEGERDFAWQTYVETDVGRLHESALEYRKWLLKNGKMQLMWSVYHIPSTFPCSNSPLNSICPA